MSKPDQAKLCHVSVAAMIGTLLGIMAMPVAMAQQCNSTITPAIQADLLKIFVDGGPSEITLDCHDFRLRADAAFQDRRRAYVVEGRLSHRVRLNPDNQWHFVVTIPEDGRQWRLGNIMDLSMRQPIPVPQGGGWEREGRRLIDELGRIAAARVRANYEACLGRLTEGPVRDHRAESASDTLECVLDFVPRVRDNRSVRDNRAN